MNSEKQYNPGEHRPDYTRVRAMGKMLVVDGVIVNKLKTLNTVVLAVLFHHFL